jgi:hypothetical protein
MPLTAGSYCALASETKEAAMKEHKVLLAFIRSTYWMRKALEEDWQGSSFAVKKHPHLQRVWTTPWIADAYLVALAQALFYAL